MDGWPKRQKVMFVLQADAAFLSDRLRKSGPASGYIFHHLIINQGKDSAQEAMGVFVQFFLRDLAAFDRHLKASQEFSPVCRRESHTTQASGYFARFHKAEQRLWLSF
jgi:hypothetical protein